MLKLGILVSGGGTNLQAIIDRIEDGRLQGCRIEAVISSREDAFALHRAEKHGIKGICLPKKSFADVDAYDRALAECLKSHGVELVVLAGFMCILGQTLVGQYPNRILNVHPSLIPSFCGKGYYGIVPHSEVLEYGVKVTGATVHFVELEADAGPIILQKPVSVLEGDTPETLQKRVMEEAEWEILPQAIQLFAEGRLQVDGRRVKIIG